MDVNAEKDRLIESLRSEITDTRVLSAMSRVPRDKFVLPKDIDLAWADQAISIGFGQTISQPLIVAMMTAALELNGNDKVLEIGTGSGYQTAILAELSGTVISVERIPELADRSQQTLHALGYSNIVIHRAGETLGWPESSPYDAIVVTAGAPLLPEGLISQVKTGGRIVIPVGSRDIQELYKVTKHKTGNRIEKLGGCRFVPLVGKEAWQINR